MLSLTSTSSWAADTTLESDTALSTEGYFVLTWLSTPETRGPIFLQQALDENFSEVRQRGTPPNGSLTVTGLENGSYYFRAGLPGTGWSDTVVVEVRHHSLRRAVFFFVTGLILFLTLVFTIVLGNRRQGGSHDAG